MSRLFTTMTGSVVTCGDTSQTKRGRGGRGDKENGQPKKRAKAKARGSGGSDPNAPPSINLPEEEDVKATVVTCKVGVRSKLWVDDMLSCCNHIINHLSKLCGQATNLQDLKSVMIRQCMLFCFTGSVRLTTSRGTKVYKKWSVLRPVLKEFATWHLLQDMTLCQSTCVT